MKISIASGYDNMERLTFSPKKSPAERYMFKSSPHEAHVKIINQIGMDKKVLDVGCASGYLAKHLKKNNCYVVGIEIDREAAEIAKGFCDNIIIGDVEHMETLFNYKEFFDVIIYADILEHLKRPDLVLKEFKKYLSPNGYVIASIPNVAYWRVRLKLLLGKFDYEDTGTLDETHLRFFTLASIKRLFKSTGYEVQKILYTGWASKFKIFRIFTNLFAFQFIIVAKQS